MTRFARAKGSKASNQRLPDESTPWSELKQQVESNGTGSEETPEGTNWKEVINTEKKVEENVNSVWCDFSDDENNKASKKSDKKNKNEKRNNSFERGEIAENALKWNNKRKKRSLSDTTEGDFDNLETSKKGKFTNISLLTSPEEKSHDLSTKETNDPSDWAEGFDWKDSIKPEENVFKRKFGSSKQSDIVRDKFSGSKNWSVTGRKFKKFTTSVHERRKIDSGDVTLDVNGQKITVTKLDGFYIRKEDADRIKQLEKDLLQRGVSTEEIRAVIKKERRNAEKSLSRQKKKVCFHCRKGGHNLSSCPKLGEGEAQVIGSGICYKCGSTEHSYINCRVTSGQTFKFATCFICKEEGHIAKQCPDNPRGLYPDGGACKLCGDVTHFKKDCPQLPVKTKITVGTIDRNIETLGDIEEKQTSQTVNQKKKKKMIKFK